MTRIVVGAAILREGRVLAAQRNHPPELAGRWELPGGKVEPGESEPAALIRECREELGVVIEVGPRLGPSLPTADGEFLLKVFSCELAHGSAEPHSREHRELRWVGPQEVADLHWLDADLPMVTHLMAALSGNGS